MSGLNTEEIIRMAREAGFESNSLGMTYTSGLLPDFLERFAALVAAAEREACAKYFEDSDYMMYRSEVAIAIRARGNNAT